MAVAIPSGAVLATGVGFAAVAAGIAGPRPLLGGVVFALVSLAACVGLVWVLVVDRSTLEGASSRPTESVESAWFATASSASFTDTVTIAGIALIVVVWTGAEISAAPTLIGVLAVAAASFALRYALARRTR